MGIVIPQPMKKNTYLKWSLCPGEIALWTQGKSETSRYVTMIMNFHQLRKISEVSGDTFHTTLLLKNMSSFHQSSCREHMFCHICLTTSTLHCSGKTSAFLSSPIYMKGSLPNLGQLWHTVRAPTETGINLSPAHSFTLVHPHLVSNHSFQISIDLIKMKNVALNILL